MASSGWSRLGFPVLPECSILNSMDTYQVKIHVIGRVTPRFVIVRKRPETGECLQYWDGKQWVGELRAAMLYAHDTLVREDVKKMRQQR